MKNKALVESAASALRSPKIERDTAPDRRADIIMKNLFKSISPNLSLTLPRHHVYRTLQETMLRKKEPRLLQIFSSFSLTS